MLDSIDIDLDFEQDKDLGKFVGYIDFDFVEDLDNHRSAIGHLFALTRDLVSWRSIM